MHQRGCFVKVEDYRQTAAKMVEIINFIRNHFIVYCIFKVLFINVNVIINIIIFNFISCLLIFFLHQ